MRTIHVEFAFEIGQKVYFRSARHTVDQEPTSMIIVERIAQECHGGIQRLYKVHGQGSTCTYPEVVLRADKPAYEPVSDERLADIGNQREAQSLGRWSGMFRQPEEKPEEK